MRLPGEKVELYVNVQRRPGVTWRCLEEGLAGHCRKSGGPWPRRGRSPVADRDEVLNECRYLMPVVRTSN